MNEEKTQDAPTMSSIENQSTANASAPNAATTQTATGAANAAATQGDQSIANRKKPDILFISGSPRKGASVALVELLEQGARKAGAQTQHFLLSQKHIDPCTGCGHCEKTGVCILASRTRDGHFSDDYLELKAVLDRVDAVGIVAPLYFAGPTSQFKALMDRFQPYYAQRYLLKQKPAAKRPAQLYLIGAGGDEHGSAPLTGITRSAFNVAGFSLEKVHDFVGFLPPQDALPQPSREALESMPTTELVRLRRAHARQQDFEERALSAGGAFARYVVKLQQAHELSAQLEELKTELEELISVGDGIKTNTEYESRDEIELEYQKLLRKGKSSLLTATEVAAESSLMPTAELTDELALAPTAEVATELDGAAVEEVARETKPTPIGDTQHEDQ